MRVALDSQADLRDYVIVEMLTGCYVSNFACLLFFSQRSSFTLQAVLGLKYSVTCLIPFMFVEVAGQNTRKTLQGETLSELSCKASAAHLCRWYQRTYEIERPHLEIIGTAVSAFTIRVCL